MHDNLTSEKSAQLQEEITILRQRTAVLSPRLDSMVDRIRNMATDLHGRILHLEAKADAESESLQQLCANCQKLETELAASRDVNHHLTALLNNSMPHANQEPD